MAENENTAPRRGRHAAARHAARRVPEPTTDETLAADEEAPQLIPSASGTFPQVVTIADGDQETHMGDAPRPIDAEASASGSFARIAAEDGARVTTRANASESASLRFENARPVEAVRMSTAGRPKVERHEITVKSNGRVFVGLAIGALLVLVLVGTLLSRALLSVEKVPEQGVEEQTQATGNEGIEYRGVTYAVAQQEGGKFALTSISGESQKPAVLYELAGTPVGDPFVLILYNTVFVIPENLDDGTWDLIAYPLGGGSVAQRVTDGEGKPIVGQGQIEAAELSGDVVEVALVGGGHQTVSLV